METNIHEGNLQKVDRILEMTIDRISGITIAPCAVALVAWVFLFVAYVSGRFFFQLGWLFVEEYTTYWVVFVAYFSWAYGVKTGTHIRTDIVTSQLPKRVNSVLEIVIGLLAILLVGYLTWKSIGWLAYGIEYEARAVSGLHTLQWPIYSFVTIGLGLFALVLLLKFVRNVIRLARGREIEIQTNIE